jgi:hypothetical protein
MCSISQLSQGWAGLVLQMGWLVVAAVVVAQMMVVVAAWTMVAVVGKMVQLQPQSFVAASKSQMDVWSVGELPPLQMAYCLDLMMLDSALICPPHT